jgi:hypothetical protein
MESRPNRHSYSTPKIQDMRRYLPFAIIGAVLLLGSASALLLFRSMCSSMPINVASGKVGAEPSHIRGAANARVTLEEFGDFQCKPCAVLAATLLKVEHNYGSSVRVVFRQFPLGMHVGAFTAACAAEAAGLQGRFWEMHDLLFQNAMHWSIERPRPFVIGDPNVRPNGLPQGTAMGLQAIFAGYATTLGLDVERFKRDMDSEQVKTRIKTDQERGASLGVNQTPTLYIDGARIPFPSLNEKGLRGVIDATLSGPRR